MLRWKLAQWLELLWWKKYLRNKNPAQYLVWKKNYWSTILAAVADYVYLNNPAKICDLGCGPAGIFIVLDKHEVTAVDPLMNKYLAQIPVVKTADYSYVQFVCSTIEEFEARQKFDFVFCMNAINHVRDIQLGFKISALMAENGTLVLTVDAHNYSGLKYLFRLIPGDVLHPHQYNLGDYELFLTGNGFRLRTTQLVKSHYIFNHYLIVAQKC